MSKYLKFFVTVISASVLLFIPAKNIFAYGDAIPAASPTLESITAYDSSIKINTDSSIDVAETINYNFGNAYKHGIFRTIPIHYSNSNGNYNLRISNISVTDNSGQPYQVTTSVSGNNELIKIGDPNNTITGSHVYVIYYKISGAINFFSDHDELYWNSIGPDWQVPIANATTTVILPQEIALSQLSYTCYTGMLGSKAPCLDKKASNSQGNSRTTDSSKADIIQFSQLGPLQFQSFFTVVVGIPKGIVYEPSFWEKFLGALADNWVLGLPLITFIILFYIWFTKGRDPRVSDVVVAEYEAPDNLSPAEVAVIYNSSSSAKDISAEIINLAVKGYLTIERTEKKELIFKHTDYIFHKIKNSDDGLTGAQKILLTDLFSTGDSVSLSDLKQKFVAQLQAIQQAVYQSCVDKKYFRLNPKKVKAAFASAGGLVIFISLYLNHIVGGYAIFALIITGLLIMAFGFAMHEHTVLGVETKRKIAGLKLYLNIAEKDRINFANAPAKDPQHFEKLLPYAMVLGVEKQWANQFAGIYNTPPVWYNDSYGGTFTTILFINSLDSFSDSTNASLGASAPNAAGGGSGFGGGGGGGFGGGGGGSW